MTFRIVTDSTADLSEDYLQKYDIEVLGMTVTIGDQTFPTIGENSLSNEHLLREIKAGKTVQTSQINSGQFSELFKKFISQNPEEEIVYLAFSSGLSGTYQSAVIAREMVLEEYPQAKITVVDTLAAASGEGFLVQEMVELRESGKSLTEALLIFEELILRLKSLFMVDDLNHLARGGRIPKAVAMVGTMANIKPLLTVDSEGKLTQLTKVRGKKKAIKSLVDMTLEEMDPDYSRVIVAYSGSEATAQEVKELFLAQHVDKVDIRPLSPTIVTHTGSGTLAIFSIAKKNRN
ncbi:DegV family protein [Lactococcus formosensis]|jgi:EDD domain protein, DegV family|uniref:DegV family protein n=2 Tax=Lactococcus formosensis TaxID=1281486 RepID=A0A9Q8Y0Z3_9LACT|nr:DegV family protein [Lactococcus formosensis]MCH1723900.1 DegV family protein [Lactococcus formosensis]MCO7181021.1 DegV family protein [Lactococcus formosensis]MDG6112144.1 DegV family protein [Lactococcus formosensis]MDG6114261.1 DegV family protein [Lactococcus formosensis]MDG6116058.1 DegV family protein [Lactococcus formosensis]